MAHPGWTPPDPPSEAVEAGNEARGARLPAPARPPARSGPCTIAWAGTAQGDSATPLLAPPDLFKNIPSACVDQCESAVHPNHANQAVKPPLAIDSVRGNGVSTPHSRSGRPHTCVFQPEWAQQYINPGTIWPGELGARALTTWNRSRWRGLVRMAVPRRRPAGRGDAVAAAAALEQQVIGQQHYRRRGAVATVTVPARAGSSAGSKVATDRAAS